MKLTVEMTEDDIERGWAGCAITCALARAIRRAAREAGMRVDVGGTICRYGKEYIATMPEECGAFVEEFDNGEAEKPLMPFDLFFVPFDGEEKDYYPGSERDTRFGPPHC